MQQELPKAIENEESSPLDNIKKSLDLKTEAVILCQTKENNPNYLSVIYANQKFYEIFGIDQFNLIGKSYDFLFSDITENIIGPISDNFSVSNLSISHISDDYLGSGGYLNIDIINKIKNNIIHKYSLY